MNAWFNNYTPFYYWPEDWWPDFGAGTGTQTITLTGHQVEFSYGTATVSTIGSTTRSGGGWGYYRIQKPKPRKKKIISRSTVEAFESGRQTLRQKVTAGTSRATGNGGGRVTMRLQIRALPVQLGESCGTAALHHARKQTIRPYAGKLRTTNGGAKCRPKYTEHDEELALLLALTK